MSYREGRTQRLSAHLCEQTATLVKIFRKDGGSKSNIVVKDLLVF